MGELDVRGYGVTPRGARERAATLRAVSASPATPARPVLWVAICGAVAVVSLLFLIHTVAAYGTELMPGFEASVRFIVLGALYGFGVWGFCYGWELYDTRKAARLAIVLGVFGLAIVIVAALVLVLLAKAGDDLDIDLGDLGGGVRSVARGAGSAALNVAEDLAPTAAGVYSENVRPPWLPPEERPTSMPPSRLVDAHRTAAPASRPRPLPPDDARGIDCRRCNFRFDPRDRLGCPACGQPI